MNTTSSATAFALLRERSGMDLVEVAEEFNVAPETIQGWESGQSSVPDRVIRTLSVLADFTSTVEPTVTQIMGSGALESPKPSPEAEGRRRKAQLGQFMTPPSVASFMARLFSEPFPNTVSLLDAGAGRAALTKAFVDRWREQGRGHLIAHAYEADPAILIELHENLEALRGIDVDAQLIEADFIAATAMKVRSGKAQLYTHAILNPPYKKIGNASAERAYLRGAGLETVNLYSGFVWLALQMLKREGELVAIIPRSFCNGPYYKPFRRSLLSTAALVQMHLFDTRDQAFKHDKVLQENVIIHVRRGTAQSDVVVSTSRDDNFSDYQARIVPFDRIVFPDDEGQFIHIPTNEADDHLELRCFRNLLSEIGIDVSTGPVVDFRLRDHLRADPGPSTVPLLYPGHFVNGDLLWPRPGFKKSNAVVRGRETEKWLYPHGFYTVVRRFSAKEERRRIVANVVDPDRAPGTMLGFENHLNVFHEKRQPLPEALARGLAIFLNATAVDRYFRRFNGHTQVNATDLRTMRYPDRGQLEALGRWALQTGPISQEAIDDEVEQLG